MTRKDAYVEKARAKIDEYAARLDVLKAKAKGEAADQKIVAYEKIGKLEAKLRVVKSQLNDLTDSAGDAWEGLSGRFEEMADDLGASVKKLTDKFK